MNFINTLTFISEPISMWIFSLTTRVFHTVNKARGKLRLFKPKILQIIRFHLITFWNTGFAKEKWLWQITWLRVFDLIWFRELTIGRAIIFFLITHHCSGFLSVFKFLPNPSTIKKICLWFFETDDQNSTFSKYLSWIKDVL